MKKKIALLCLGSVFTLFLTSCQDDMDKGGAGGTGRQDNQVMIDGGTVSKSVIDSTSVESDTINIPR